MKSISATQLTHNTRKVIKEVNDNKEPVIITSYNMPIAILSPLPKAMTDSTLMVKDESRKSGYKVKSKKKKNPLADFVGKFHFPDADPDAAINHNDIYDI